MSRLPPKSVPLLVRVAFCGRRHRASSHRRSTFHFPFVLSYFPTPGLHSLITCRVLNSLFPPMSLCEIVCCKCMCTSDWFCGGLFYPYFVLVGTACFCIIKVLQLLPISAFLRLTSCSQLRTTYRDLISMGSNQICSTLTQEDRGI